MVKYSIVVPAYNEEKNIPILHKKVTSIMNKIDGSWELIFINDGSKDKTLEVLQKLSKKDKKVKYLDLSRNFGHQSALSAGLDYAKGNAIVSMDCDMQDPPELIIEMVKKWKKGYEVVYARRKNRNDGFFKKYSALAYYRLLDRFSSTKIPRNVGDFRLVDRKVLDQLNSMKEKSRYLRGLVAWLGYKFTYVEFDRPERTEGETGYTLSKMMKLAMDGILNFSMFPLKVGLLMGMISIAIGSFALLYMIGDILINNQVYELFKWLSVVLLMFMGFSFMLIWILGEYIGRIYDEVKGRPLYVVRENGNF
jgi:polyisoprenyl-phosphate glycosyltransferase